jgi:alpha-ketoglutarate-dependent taurine dioxygenase
MKGDIMFQSIDLSERVGSEIRADREGLISGDYSKEIEKLLVQRSALVFRELFFTDEEQKKFADTIGKVIPLGEEGVSKISLDPTVSDTADYTRGAFFWHIDGANDVTPAKATMLTAKVLSDEGGDTLICNTYAAYEDLPQAEKKDLERVRIRHALEATQRLVHPQPTAGEIKRWRTRPSQTHPLVWHHQHGGTSLLLGATCLYVHDVNPEDSSMLLARLQDWATQNQYVYRHKWKVGDFLLWDNTGTMHRADSYPLNSKRLMHRTTLHGEEPVS